MSMDLIKNLAFWLTLLLIAEGVLLAVLLVLKYLNRKKASIAVTQ